MNKYIIWMLAQFIVGTASLLMFFFNPNPFRILNLIFGALCLFMVPVNYFWYRKSKDD